jgi:glycosyltransferase involved in cell wall biosynthesis
MRVCHVSPHLPPDQAANALLPAELGAWAHARGDLVTYVAHAPAQGRPAIDLPSGRIWRVSRKSGDTGLRRLLRLDSLQQARAISAALESAARDADLLHLHSNGLIVEVAAAWAARRNLPYVLTLYGTEIWHFKPRWPVDPFARAYRRAAEVTFYSRRLMERARAVGLDRPGLGVVYPTVSAAFCPLNAERRASVRADLGITEPRLVLNVKRLHELAGQKYLIEAFARVSRGRSDLRLVVCGAGPLREALEAQARDAGAAQKVTFTGLVDNDTVARYAAAADVFVLPSLLEALPTVAVEALACGTPVISADHPGGLELNELFGEDVLIVPRTNVDGLATALAEAVDAPQRVRPATLDLVHRHFGQATVEAAYQAVYRRALGARPAADAKAGGR